MALGLFAGWGTVAIHGEEGFRSERGRVLCLFTDLLLAPPPVAPLELAFGTGWMNASRAIGWKPRPAPLHPHRARVLQETASAYGVPLLTLSDALRHRVLDELGAGAPTIREEVERWTSFSALAH